MPHSLYALAFLACPLGMGLMMWIMMRGNKQHSTGDAINAPQGAELARMQAEIDQLRRNDRERAG